MFHIKGQGSSSKIIIQLFSSHNPTITTNLYSHNPTSSKEHPISIIMKAFIALFALFAVAAANGYGSNYGGGYAIPMQPTGSTYVRTVPNTSYGWGAPTTYVAPGATFQAAPVTYAAPMITFNPPQINYSGQAVTYATSGTDGYGGSSYGGSSY